MKTELEFEVIQAAAAGCDAARSEIFKTHERMVYGLCMRILHVPEDAEDLTQECFIQIFRKLSSFKGDAKLSTWIHRLTLNQCLMFLRTKKAKPEMTSIDDEEHDTLATPKSASFRGEIEARLQLEKMLASLPGGYRDVLLLHDYHGFEHSEVAAIINRSEGTSKSQLHKARIRARKLLGKKANPRVISPVNIKLAT